MRLRYVTFRTCLRTRTQTCTFLTHNVEHFPLWQFERNTTGFAPLLANDMRTNNTTAIYTTNLSKKMQRTETSINMRIHELTFR